jgi:uncharacterized protein YdeI (YjbR/CyaY-like superfamily)
MMANAIKNPKVDFYFAKAESWQKEIDVLRKIVLDCGLKEELKWGSPCYTFQKANVVLIHVFKEYCGLLFFKGALLKDPGGILVQQSKNVQAARQARFTNSQEIIELEPRLKSCILEAVEVEKAGLKVELKKTEEYEVPEEFKKVLIKNKTLQKAFASLTPGRQRGYLLYFSAPKQARTREARVEKSLDKIIAGKGLND